MDKGKHNLAIAFTLVLVVVAAVSIVGMILFGKQTLVLQGQIEATEIRISGKLPGRIDEFRVVEGQNVLRGDTLVIINSPEAMAKYAEAAAIESAAKYQNQKIDDGTRRQIVESLRQQWNGAKAELNLAEVTYRRVEQLYRDSVVTSQRKDEAEALHQAAQAAERAAYQQYRMAVLGAQKQDRESARSMVEAAGAAVGQVSALLQDSHLTAPANGQISAIYPKQGELVGAGAPIMTLVVLDKAHAVLNVREDLLPSFTMGGLFEGDVPAIAAKGIKFRINYISPLGSYATWRSTKQVGSYDMRTFELHALPEKSIAGLRPGMSVLVDMGKTVNR